MYGTTALLAKVQDDMKRHHDSQTKHPPMPKVESGVPMPEITCSKYPLDRMKVGDSFLVSIDDASPNAVRSAAGQYSKRHAGLKFRVHLMKSERGTRVWRTA